MLVACLVGFLFFFSGATNGAGGSQTAEPGAAAITGIATLVAIGACIALARRTAPPTGRGAGLLACPSPKFATISRRPAMVVT